MLLDKAQRPLRDLRISVTDRCNFRCSYCMPKAVYDQNFKYLAQESLLTFEELTRLSRCAVQLGVEKIRITGGEPLLRKNLEVLIEQLRRITTPEGKALDLTLTTNASLLSRKAKALKDAGLSRLTVSLDGMDDAVFRRMNDVDFPVADVLTGLETAQKVGFENIKINMVVKRGTNEQEILPMLKHFIGSGMRLRFIEYMDVGHSNGWRMDEVMPSSEVLALIQSAYQTTPLPASQAGETAERWRIQSAAGQSGEIGLISSVSKAFCHSCNRARLSTEGKLYLCLFASRGFDLRASLRKGASDAELIEQMRGIWQNRNDRYSELRAQGLAPMEKRIEMSYIGG